MHPLIHDWNRTADRKPSTVMLDDETLRDGLQSPSVRCPTIEQKIEILHLMDALGIDTANIGLPGAGPHVVRGRRAPRARDCRRSGCAVQANCAARTRRRRHRADRRDLAADRHADRVLHVHRLEPDPAVRRRLDDRSAAAADRRGDRVRGPRRAAGDVRHRGHDARAIRRRCARCIRPRSGPARRASASPTPSGTPRRRAPRRSSASSRGVVAECGGGRRHRLARPPGPRLRVVNALAALEAGATRLHGAAIGIGERVGNTPMDLLLVNLVLMG